MGIGNHRNTKRHWRNLSVVALSVAVVMVSSPAKVARAAGPEQLAQTVLGESFANGMAAMRARNYRQALVHFQVAMKAEPKDSRPWMMQGMALNRLGRFAMALGSLDRSASLGMTAPRLDFETGWAALNAGLPQRAVERLNAYEKSKPGDAKTAEFLGRAYFQLGKLDDAERLLQEAIRRDISVKPTVQVYLAQIAAKRGDQRKTVTELLQAWRDAPNSPVGQSVRDTILRPLALRRLARKRQSDKPWSAYASTSAGYNDNVIGLSSELPQPPEITNRASVFLTVEAGAQYVHRIGDDQSVTGRYGVHYDNFFDVADQDVFDHNLFVRYARAIRQLPGDVVASVMGSYGHTQVDGSRFRNSVGIRPSVSFRPADNFSVELFYGRSFSDVRESPTGSSATTDRDSTLTSVGGQAVIAIPDTGISVSVGAARLHNNADGTDHGYRGNRFSVGTRLTLFDSYLFTGEVAKTSYNYTSPHSLAPNTATGAGFTFARKDDVTSVNLRVSRPVNDRVSVFAKFDYTRAQSNLLLFSYSQNVFGAGVVARF